MDKLRLEVISGLDRKERSSLGQFMTPSRIACFMAALFESTGSREAFLLDAGAGVGSLTAAFLDRWEGGGFGFERVEASAYEIDETLRRHLAHNLASYEKNPRFRSSVYPGDFIETAVEAIQFQHGPRFTHAILNPPYKKLASASRHRRLLREVGIETVNLYSAFVALSVVLMKPGGQISVIIPRSFCNGPYYRPFREFLLDRTAIRHIHLFDSRKKAFKDDEVLQENVILLLEVEGEQGSVRISTSTDATFGDLTTQERVFEQIVFPEDSEKFIHIPTNEGHDAIGALPFISASLSDLGISVSTGPVVDFRLREHIRKMPDSETVPLLYPTHFAGGELEWPKVETKKPNAIVLNEATKKWLFPTGRYTVTKRFSSKEERRRIVASVITPSFCKGSGFIGLENHLNVFHINRKGLPEDLAQGLAVYLNSTVADMYLRRFSGHTQVNATDLRLLKYPVKSILLALGKWAKRRKSLSQQQIDKKVEELTK